MTQSMHVNGSKRPGLSPNFARQLERFREADRACEAYSGTGEDVPDDLFDRRCEIYRTIMEIPTDSLADIALKVRLAEGYCPGADTFNARELQQLFKDIKDVEFHSRMSATKPAREEDKELDVLLEQLEAATDAVTDLVDLWDCISEQQDDLLREYFGILHENKLQLPKHLDHSRTQNQTMAFERALKHQGRVMHDAAQAVICHVRSSTNSEARIRATVEALQARFPAPNEPCADNRDQAA